MAMKELCSKFLSMFHYVPYIIDEKPKIQRFLSCFPIMFKEQIEYDNPNMLAEVMRKANLCYDQNKNKRESVPNLKTKRQDKFDPIKKNNKFHKNTGNNYKGYQGSNHKILNHRILQQKKENLPLLLIRTLDRANP